MISCLLQGGLGNQLFQVSAALSLSKDLGVDCLFPFDNHYLPLQGNKANTYIDNIFCNLKPLEQIHYNTLKVVNESNFSYNKLPIIDNIILKGFFQSEKYFKHNESFIRKIFKMNEKTKDLIDTHKHIFKGNTCSIHVRRGDYLKFPNEHPVLSIEYYKKAMGYFNDDTTFIIFSDDEKWAKENIKGKNVIYIQRNIDYIDLYLMSMCDNNIIANSSFSWWGAWLNENQNKKVIAPSQWFGINKKLDTKDLIPENWIKI